MDNLANVTRVISTKVPSVLPDPMAHISRYHQCDAMIRGFNEYATKCSTRNVSRLRDLYQSRFSNRQPVALHRATERFNRLYAVYNDARNQYWQNPCEDTEYKLIKAFRVMKRAEYHMHWFRAGYGFLFIDLDNEFSYPRQWHHVYDDRFRWSDNDPSIENRCQRIAARETV